MRFPQVPFRFSREFPWQIGVRRRWACSVDVDGDTCCHHAVSCTNHRCPRHHVRKRTSSNIFCNFSSCSDVDHETRCDMRPPCDTISCHHGYSLKSGVPGVGADTCHIDFYLDYCCDRHEMCNALIVLPGYVLKPTPESIACNERKCDIGTDDLYTCCNIGACGEVRVEECDCSRNCVSSGWLGDSTCDGASKEFAAEVCIPTAMCKARNCHGNAQRTGWAYTEAG